MTTFLTTTFSMKDGDAAFKAYVDTITDTFTIHFIPWTDKQGIPKITVVVAQS